MAEIPHQGLTKENSNRFWYLLGCFHVTWALTDLTTDYAIWKFLGGTPLETHIITSGMMFGRKAKLLADLIANSNHPKKSEILGAFNKVRDHNKRNIIAHSYYLFDEKNVCFVERSNSGPYNAKEHTFPMDEFEDHVAKMGDYGQAFHSAIGASRELLTEFAHAALNRDHKSNTLPQ